MRKHIGSARPDTLQLLRKGVLLHHEPPFARLLFPDHETAMVVREGGTVERTRTLVAMPHHACVATQQKDGDLGAI